MALVLRFSSLIVALMSVATAVSAHSYDGDARLRFGVFMQGHVMPAEESKPAARSSDLNGAGLGASFGYDWSLSNGWVIGAEADGVVTGGSAKFAADKYENDYMATFRARFGRQVNSDWFVYGTTGWALNGLHYNGATTPTNANPNPILKVSGTLHGWTIGGGAEYRIYDMVLFGEYLFTNFQNFDFTGGFNVNHNLDTDAHVFRLGVKWLYGHDHYVDDVKAGRR